MVNTRLMPGKICRPAAEQAGCRTGFGQATEKLPLLFMILIMTPGWHGVR
jgi:hypothetical protein